MDGEEKRRKRPGHGEGEREEANRKDEILLSGGCRRTGGLSCIVYKPSIVRCCGETGKFTRPLSVLCTLEWTGQIFVANASTDLRLPPFSLSLSLSLCLSLASPV